MTKQIAKPSVYSKRNVITEEHSSISITNSYCYQ